MPWKVSQWSICGLFHALVRHLFCSTLSNLCIWYVLIISHHNHLLSFIQDQSRRIQQPRLRRALLHYSLHDHPKGWRPRGRFILDCKEEHQHLQKEVRVHSSSCRSSLVALRSSERRSYCQFYQWHARNWRACLVSKIPLPFILKYTSHSISSL